MTTLEEVSAKLESVENELATVKGDLEFYKSIFQTHGNSAVFNLRIKSINGERLWVDKVRADYNLKYN